ncbi:MAG: hypothetical protein WBF90_09640 [Rivularia sp. (in: cyanobacteria)]
MLKRFYAIAALSTASAAMLLPALFSTSISTQALAKTPAQVLAQTPTLVSEEPIIRDIKTKEDGISEIYRGTVSSDKLDLLRKQPESALKKAGIKVRNGAKIKVIDEINNNSARRLDHRIDVYYLGNGIYLIVIREV